MSCGFKSPTFYHLFAWMLFWNVLKLAIKQKIISHKRTNHFQFSAISWNVIWLIAFFLACDWPVKIYFHFGKSLLYSHWITLIYKICLAGQKMVRIYSRIQWEKVEIHVWNNAMKIVEKVSFDLNQFRSNGDHWFSKTFHLRYCHWFFWRLLLSALMQ